MSATASDKRASGGRGPGPGGFTLIELLVVISIVLILAALLAPSISAVRDRAKEVICQSKLRQLGQALNLFMSDNNGFPGHHHTNPSCIVWPHRLRSYVGNDHEVFRCPVLPEEFTWPVTYTSTKPHPQYGQYGYYEGEDLFMPNSYPFGYGYNDWGTQEFSQPHLGLGGHVTNPAHMPGHAGRVKRPAHMVAIGDSRADGLWDTALDPTIESGSANDESPSERHRGGANILFVDGHVKWVVYADVMERTAENMRLWNNDNEPHPNTW